jgi:hypothetical protein
MAVGWRINYFVSARSGRALPKCPKKSGGAEKRQKTAPDGFVALWPFARPILHGSRSEKRYHSVENE